MIAHVSLPHPVLDQLRACQAAHPGHEACGLLLVAASDSHINVQAAARLPNRARNPRTSFRLHAADIHAQAARWITTPPSLGVFHSHPHGPATPSLLDRASMRRHPGLWLILAPGELRAYWTSARSVRPVPIHIHP